MKIYKEPWKSRIPGLKNVTWVTETERGLSFSWKEARIIALSTGLRSRKTRAIKKRFKKIMHIAVMEMVNDHKEKANNS